MSPITYTVLFCIILDIYAREQSEDSEPHMITSSKTETLRSDSLVNPQFPIPMLTGVNPFDMKNQITKDVSNQLTNWLQSLRTVSLFRPIPLSNAGSLLGNVQTYPLTANLTRLGNFGQFMGNNRLPLKSLNHEQKRRSSGIERNVPTITDEKTNGDKTISTKNTFAASKTHAGSEAYALNGNVTGTTRKYHNIDLAVRKIPEAEEINEETDNTARNSLTNLDDAFTKLNLSQTQSATFIKIIDKIIDEELKKRRDERMSEAKLADARVYESDSESGKNINDNYDEEIRPHEKLTANTRLSFDEHIIDNYRNGETEISEALPGGSFKLNYQKEG
ncbi:unnamed protein product [Onchocerca ochengi]|uniref:SXP/RAL-2 family protein Ani s 5-like cation-binding domain-containing protein n=1 Tax=Onchocerca ochengi TaxID=42157 RepID=A0A182EHF9_ONCOC|nr:unnamed protein product [Onchocerca ochengi]